jgi:YHS domain-containing protein
VDRDQRMDLVQRFGVTMLPTDVFLDPRGYLISLSAEAKDLSEYRSLLASIDARFSEARAARIASQSKPVVAPPTTPAPAPRSTPIVTETTAPRHVTPPPLAPNPVAPNPGAVRREQWGTLARTAPPETEMRPVPYSAIRRPRTVGLHGYSPVALVADRQWVRGDSRYAMEYKGVIYQLASVDEFRRFRESPERFAPQVLGCDPVILDITDRAVSGDIRYAAFFDGELFLFVSDKSRQFFEQDPERFVRTKHVLNVDELDDKRLQ